MTRLSSTLLVILAAVLPACADEPATISPAVRNDSGILTHDVTSAYQAGVTQVRVLLPREQAAGTRFPVIYVLPVEAGRETRYGDGLVEMQKHELADKHRAIFVAPSFSHLPWYADHPTDLTIRQESYFLKVVVPLVEANYPAIAEPSARLLLGFSKSGWGALVLLARHPDTFGSAAAWDAPLMMDRPGLYRSGEIFGTPENFERYHLARLMRERAPALGQNHRIILLGYGSFRQPHQQFHALLEALQVPHEYRDGPERTHDWHSGWCSEAVELLLRRDS